MKPSSFGSLPPQAGSNVWYRHSSCCWAYLFSFPYPCV